MEIIFGMVSRLFAAFAFISYLPVIFTIVNHLLIFHSLQTEHNDPHLTTMFDNWLDYSGYTASSTNRKITKQSKSTDDLRFSFGTGSHLIQYKWIPVQIIQTTDETQTCLSYRSGLADHVRGLGYRLDLPGNHRFTILHEGWGRGPLLH
jgi:hypothetical protein